MPTRESHEGYVTDNQDPEKRGRLSVIAQTIVAGEVLEWVEPSFPFVDSEGQAGCVFIPSIGSSVTVEINSDAGSSVTDLQPKWKCDIYPDGTFPEEFEENYPERRGFKTKAGHVLWFDDTDGDQTMVYRHPSGTEILVTNDGRIELKPVSGQSVYVGDGADQPIPLGNLLVDFLNSIRDTYAIHKHGGVLAGGALTLVPDNILPTADATILSTDHKVK